MFSNNSFQPFTGAWNFCVALGDDNLVESRSFSARCYCDTLVAMGWTTSTIARAFLSDMLLMARCPACGNTFAIQQNRDGIETVSCYRRR